MGIFPAANIYIRDHLSDAEGRLAEVYQRMISGRSDSLRAASNSVSGLSAKMSMGTLHEEEEDVDEVTGRPRSPRGPRSRLLPRTPTSGTAGDDNTQGASPMSQGLSPISGEAMVPSSATTSEPKPPPPRPAVKSSDETTSGAQQPLVDEIAAALREWHPLMFKHLQRRDYRLFETMKGHIEALHLGRRQLLTQTLSAEEMANLRKDCVVRLVQGNVAQGLDIIVRQPNWGALVTVDSDTEVDPRSWMSGPRMYAMQASLAYVNQDPAAATSLPKSSALSDAVVTGARRGSVSDRVATASAFPPPSPSFTPSTSASSHNRRASLSAASPPVAVPFFHLYLELRAFVASPCAPGETAELYFSLYNKNSGQFVTEDFCTVLNHNGVSARDPEGRFGPVRSLFRDLGERDVQDELYLVCRIVRNGAMKIAGSASTNGGIVTGGTTPNGGLGSAFGSLSSRRGSEPILSSFGRSAAPPPAVESDDLGASTNGRSGSVVPRGPDAEGAPAMFRRPFGASVISLAVLKQFAVGSDSTDTIEYPMPIFVPVNEAKFSTLHQELIASNTKEFERSPRLVIMLLQNHRVSFAKLF